MIGENIKMYRLAANLSQRDLAKNVGASQPTIAQYETGTRKPGLNMLEKIAVCLGVSPVDLEIELIKPTVPSFALKTCPFCGGEAQNFFVIKNSAVFVGCKCGTKKGVAVRGLQDSGKCTIEEINEAYFEAAKLWNERTRKQ